MDLCRPIPRAALWERTVARGHALRFGRDRRWRPCLNVYGLGLLVDVDDFGGGEAVEPGGGGVAVGSDVVGEDQVFDFQVGQLFGLGDGVQAVAGLAEDRATAMAAVNTALEIVHH